MVGNLIPPGWDYPIARRALGDSYSRFLPARAELLASNLCDTSGADCVAALQSGKSQCRCATLTHTCTHNAMLSLNVLAVG